MVDIDFDDILLERENTRQLLTLGIVADINQDIAIKRLHQKMAMNMEELERIERGA